MALFEGYERRIAQISSFLAANGIASLDEAEQLCLARGVDVRKIVKSIQPIAFENAGWAYLVGAAVLTQLADALAGSLKAAVLFRVVVHIVLIVGVHIVNMLFIKACGLYHVPE